MRLTKNFTLEEMVESETARKMGLLYEQFSPTQHIINRLSGNCHDVLQPTRDAMGCPWSISSGFRCLTLNRRLGSEDTSDHLIGDAADTYVKEEYYEDANFLRFQRTVRKSVENMIGQPLDLTDTNPNFTLFMYLIMRMDVMKIHQIIHEKGTFGNPIWIHIAHKEDRARNEILINDGIDLHRGLEIKDIFALVVKHYGE